MALPTLTKAWQHNVNNAISALGSALADNRRLLRSIKNALVGFGNNPWTVRYSSSSVVAGTAGDGVDRWSADSDLVWAAAASARSWIVLRQTGVATNYELLLSCEAASGTGTTLMAVISFSAGFTGGSTTARPTATDEQILLNGANWGGAASDQATRWSVMQSTDGQCTRMILCIAGVVTAYWLFEKPANPSTGWTNPSVSYMVAAAPTIGALSAQTSVLGKMRNSSTTGNVVITCEGNASFQIPTDTVYGNIANEITGEWNMVPLGFESYTVGVRGRHGTFQDMWMGSTSIPTGDVYPNDGPPSSAQFVQFGNLIFPWNGGAVNLS